MAKRRVPAGWRERVLSALREGYSISGAAKFAGVSRSHVYRNMERSPKFREQVNQAYDEGTDRLEDIALNLAAEGNGQVLMFLLKGRRPQRWREQMKMEHDAGAEFLQALAEFAKELEQAVEQEQEADTVTQSTPSPALVSTRR